jgi:DNA-binding transcriptional regulator YiaG
MSKNKHKPGPAPQIPRLIGEPLVDRLIRRHKQWGISRGDMANYIGISEDTLRNWEIKRCPPNAAAQRLIDLICREDGMKRKKKSWPAKMVNVPSPAEAVVDRLVGIRHRLGLSVVSMAKHIGVAESTLRQWEAGIRRPCTAARRLIDLLYPEETQRESLDSGH